MGRVTQQHGLLALRSLNLVTVRRVELARRYKSSLVVQIVEKSASVIKVRGDGSHEAQPQSPGQKGTET